MIDEMQDAIDSQKDMIESQQDKLMEQENIIKRLLEEVECLKVKA